MQANLWNSDRVRKLVFELSAANPILSFGFPHPEETPRYDMHYGLELGVVCSGVMRRYYRHYSMDVSAGQVWFCGMWEPHGWEIVKSPHDAFVLVIWPPILANLRLPEAQNINWLAPFMVPTAQRPQTPPDCRHEMLALARRAQAIITSLARLRLVKLQLVLLEMLAILNENWTPQTSLEKAAPCSPSIDKALQLAFSKQQWVTTREAAHACRMGRNSFSLLFQRLMGIRFSEFFLRYRLTSAADELRQNNEPIKSIALHWGFTDTSHFYRHFIKHYGCAPNRYRMLSKMRSPSGTF